MTTVSAYIDDYRVQLKIGDQFVLTISKEKCGTDGHLRTSLIFDSLLSVECERNDDCEPRYDHYNSPPSSPQFAFDVKYVVVHNGIEKAVETSFKNKYSACEFHDFLVRNCT